MIAWDTETCPIRRGLLAPPLVCVSWASPDGRDGLVHRKEAEPLLRKKLLSDEMTLANAPFDLAVVGNEFPKLMPLVFEALAEDRVYDVLNRQKLYDIAHGRYSSTSKPKFFTDAEEQRKKVFYSLDCTHQRLCGTPLEKDDWRMRYVEFWDVPISQWPEGAKFYSVEDSRAALRVHQEQDKLPDADDLFVDQFRQARAHWALHLMACWGIRTDEKAVRELDERLQREWEEAKGQLVEAGLVRKNGKRYMKAVKELMFEALGEDCHLTDKGELLFVDELARSEDKGPVEVKREILTMNDYKYVSTNAESCEEAALVGQGLLKSYHSYVHIQKLRTTYVTAFWTGVDLPIQTRFESILETGRTSSSKPNIQNLPREIGIRECFVPRKGCVFGVVDYDLAELRSLAQVCLEMVGYSKLAEALNAGFDPHLSVAAQILGISYEEALERKNAGDKEIKEYRTLAKAANFGFPGGLGAKTFIAFARGTYGVVITEEQAIALKAQWLEMWPEMRAYFKMIDSLLHDSDGISQYKSGRCRGGLSYTQACNTFFQGLTADAAKEALWEITKRQFCDPKSALYGTHLVNFVHDENILEVEEWRAHEATLEMRDIMVEVYNRWTPDVPMTAEPVLMRRWSKGAPDVCPRNDDGRLIPYEDAA